MEIQGNRLGESTNAESPQGKANPPIRPDDQGTQVRALVSSRPKPRRRTGGTAEYLTAGQIADLLQVSEKSVYRWAAGDPTFPMLKIGGAVRFPRERLIRWLREREQGLGRPRMRKRVLGVTKFRPGDALPGRKEGHMISNRVTGRSAQD
jgi:excisionase family DNA binding protein